ncbi:MAG: molybdopterin cofactor-binding domain-containing protein [Steroidobacteraceae bacterium]
MMDQQFATDRRSFLKQGGALLVGMSLAGCMATPRDNGAPSATTGTLTPARPGPPPATQLDTWLAIHEDNTATLYMGFAELGQGVTTALLQIAAEELDLGMDQIRAAPLDTQVSPNQGGTYSSASVQRGRPQIAMAAAQARAALLVRAAGRLEVPVEHLAVERGIVRVTGKPRRKVSYGELIGGERFNLDMTGSPPLKPVSAWRLLGQRVPRDDLAGKVNATHTYIQQLRLPAMLHARVVRPRGQASYVVGARVIRVDETSIQGISDVRVVRRGDFIGVLAPLEWDAVRAAQQLVVEWEQPAPLPGSTALHSHMRAGSSIDNVVLERGNVRVASDEAAFTVAQRGFAPYQAHAPFAPNCALADIRANEGLVICSSQDVYAARRSIAAVLGMREEQLRVQYAEGSGTYGHSCYDDAAQAAALLSLLAGAPVRLQLMRWDEHGWDNYGAPHVGEVRVSADAEGRLVSYEYHGWQHNWSQVETTAQLAGAAATEWPPVAAQGVNPLVCGGMYDIPNLKLVNHRLPALQYLRAGWLRSPLDLAYAFVSEQAIDQLAVTLNVDPVEYRRRNIRDPRWLGVMDAAATAAVWNRPWQPGRLGTQRLRRGRGIGLGTHLASYGAAVAEVEVDMQSGGVRVLHLVGALDAGLVINPLIVERQIEGQLVQATSRMLLEEVLFDQSRVTSLDWQSYPVLRFENCPAITAVVVQQTGEPSTGAGEETMAAAAAAVANAFFDATGRRMEQFPLTPARVLAALRAT